MERIPQMKTCLGLRVSEILAERLSVIEEALLKNRMYIWDRIEEVLSAQSNFIHSHQGYEKLTISYLRSSYITGSHIFLVTCQKEILFLEEDPPEEELDLSELFTGVDQDTERLETELNQEFIRVSEGERESIRRWYMELLYAHLGEVLKATIQKKGYLTEVPLLYGGYMEEQRQVGSE